MTPNAKMQEKRIITEFEKTVIFNDCLDKYNNQVSILEVSKWNNMPKKIIAIRDKIIKDKLTPMNIIKTSNQISINKSHDHLNTNIKSRDMKKSFALQGPINLLTPRLECENQIDRKTPKNSSFLQPPGSPLKSDRYSALITPEPKSPLSPIQPIKSRKMANPRNYKKPEKSKFSQKYNHNFKKLQKSIKPKTKSDPKLTKIGSVKFPPSKEDSRNLLILPKSLSPQPNIEPPIFFNTQITNSPKITNLKTSKSDFITNKCFNSTTNCFSPRRETAHKRVTSFEKYQKRCLKQVQKIIDKDTRGKPKYSLPEIQDSRRKGITGFRNFYILPPKDETPRKACENSQSYDNLKFIDCIIAKENKSGTFQIANDEQFRKIKDILDKRYGMKVPRSLKRNNQTFGHMSTMIKLNHMSSFSKVETESFLDSDSIESEELDDEILSEMPIPTKPIKNSFQNIKEKNQNFGSLKKYLNHVLIQTSSPALVRQHTQYRKMKDKMLNRRSETVYQRLQKDAKERGSKKDLSNTSDNGKQPLIRMNTNSLRKSIFHLHSSEDKTKRKTTFGVTQQSDAFRCFSPSDQTLI
ncbi:unnamed protein product [Moneuplotes crassus]|uniref:Uncharacterized protein n=1 Tax=Euplotes crassus TaxID=5936 RepID=A0AAD1XQF0_EUPCR|nr:unnamed protein product [Moneuplotes crassus]